MSTENESRQEGAANEENQNVSRDGGYKSYNRDSNYNRYNNDGEQRPYRPRTNSYNREGGDRPYRSSYNNGDRPSYNRYNNNGDRPQRPRFNPDSEDGGDQRSYRPRTNYNREGGEQRPYTPRPRFNNGEEGGERQYRPRTNYNREGGEQRPYTPRPRFNSGEGGEQRSYTPRPRTGGYNQGGDRPYRPRTGGYNQGGDRPYRPRTGGYNQGGGYNRPYRPRTADYNPNAKYSLKKQIEYKDILTDPNEPIRLNKFLANAGICSRREADEFITAGVVSVNGEVVTELGTKIKRTDEVKFHDEPVSIERKTYILLNKPKDCVTTSDDPQERKTVMDFVKGACKERIYPVGRLDRNTTGVLLLTNDGDLASKLTHPKYLKKKIYHVYCDKNVTKADLDQIAAGVTLDDGEIHADAISYASETDKSQVGIEIHSGKNRIVRRIFESLGYKVIKLDRVYFAGLTKKGLRRGDWRYLTEQEVNMLRMGSFE
ncbi:RNA-binding S4 domain-containing protein [Phocaeicola dorei]|uniref:pseudouridine synthase n=1 Tax=Phocaeicola dorei TaxID=357276 RepID=UPI001C386A9C|nr:pseudouridine synthase [Phocaeicola dorei]MBV4240610.1 RNA-binding S4 domain-containing protein [Phocaeicola dorei]MCB6463261.1 RNA-binding S4 domain-containing protein [Phocaeicola dorei]MCB6748735.1 RNA-binding S4 domain-containing protein [Phocaeicola dorei]MCB6773955.1 RNA-binding S4 domain-containing protein [Phocaeicola dorei]MCB6792920.1 RNA-binding S4 domain-containing protein [Phocaeicola dorei]